MGMVVALVARAAGAATDLPISGARLAIHDAADSQRSSVAFESDDGTIDLSRDPAANGASFRLVNPTTAEASSAYAMPGSGWRCVGGVGGTCRYKDKHHVHGPVQSVVLRSGRLKLAALGEQLDYPLVLPKAQGAVAALFVVGGARYCVTFGGSIHKDDPIHGKFLAVSAPAPATCVDPPIPTTTTVSVTTTTAFVASTTTLPGGLAAITLAGCASSDYHGTITVGGQSFSALIDSGSTTLALASNQCAQCSGISPRYTPGASAMDLGQATSSTYGDGSGWTGRAFSDLVTAGSIPAVHVALSTIDTQHSFFGSSACDFTPVANSIQGIFGLGGPQLAVTGTDPYVDDAVAAGAMPDIFAAQLCALGGRLWLGGYDPAFTTAAPHYTPLDGASPYYSVTVSDLRLGNSSLGFGAVDFGPTIVDTGTSLLLLPSAAFSALANAVAATAVFQQNFGSAAWFSGSTCNTPAQHLTKAQLDQALPPLVLQFPSATGPGSFTVQLAATDSYLLQQDDPMGHAYYCPGIDASTYTIIGGNALHGLITIFDRANQRIGFAPEQGCAILSGLTRRATAAVATESAPPLPMPPVHRRDRGW